MPDDAVFCSTFDEAFAHHGPAAVFLPDREGLLKLAPNWSREAWERAPGPHEFGWRWALFHDEGTGFVLLLLVTSPSLLTEHPRGRVELFARREEAEAARSAFGDPPVHRRAHAGG